MAEAGEGHGGESPSVAPIDSPSVDLAERDDEGTLVNLAYGLGSVGLLVATGADSLAVLGRHTGFHLLGSIEIVQSAVVLIASSAMVVATLVGSHAAVHIVTERLRTATRQRLAIIAAAISALTFAILAAGSIWLLADLWDGYEQTELLAIPLRWLRLLWIVASLFIVALLVRDAARRRT